MPETGGLNIFHGLADRIFHAPLSKRESIPSQVVEELLRRWRFESLSGSDYREIKPDEASRKGPKRHKDMLLVK